MKTTIYATGTESCIPVKIKELEEGDEWDIPTEIFKHDVTISIVVT